MTSVNQVFAIYSTAQHAELAVDELISEGFQPQAITALFDDNRNSRDFARRKDTRPPTGTDCGDAARVPLNGTLGLTEPGTGPVQGALEGALVDMGVPDEWGSGKMHDGSVLVSVECRTPAEASRVKNIFSVAADETGFSEADISTFRASRPETLASPVRPAR